MILILCWIIVIIVGSGDILFARQMDDGHFLFFCISIYYFTYIYNKIYPIKISIRMCSILIIPSSLILSYYLYNYYGFLCLDPMSEESFIFMCFTYFYLLIHLICDINIYKHCYKIKSQTFFILMFILSLIFIFIFDINKGYFSFYPLTDEEFFIISFLYFYLGLYCSFEIKKFLKNVLIV